MFCHILQAVRTLFAAPLSLTRFRPAVLTSVLMAAPRPCVVELLVMLAQEILAVIVAIWRAHHGVDVIARRLLIAQRNAALMVEFDEDDRAVDPIIEYAVFVDAAHPGEVGISQMLCHLRHSDLGMARPDVADVGL